MDIAVGQNAARVAHSHVADQPVRSSLIAVASGAALMTLVLSLMKRRRHYET